MLIEAAYTTLHIQIFLRDRYAEELNVRKEKDPTVTPPTSGQEHQVEMVISDRYRATQSTILVTEKLLSTHISVSLDRSVILAKKKRDRRTVKERGH